MNLHPFSAIWALVHAALEVVVLVFAFIAAAHGRWTEATFYAVLSLNCLLSAALAMRPPK